MMSVLITGTTSGIGKELAVLHGNDLVVHVNRGEFSYGVNGNNISITCDISNVNHVQALFENLEKNRIIVNLIYLNAGINKPDNNSGGLDMKNFREHFEVNLFGALNFVSVCKGMRLEKIKFIFMSSTSNIICNPSHLGYYLTKLSLVKILKHLSRSDMSNSYKAIILGPVETGISRHFKAPTGIQKLVLDLIIVGPGECAVKIRNFAMSNSVILRYPMKSFLFYWLVKYLVALAPSIYQTSDRK